MVVLPVPGGPYKQQARRRLDAQVFGQGRVFQQQLHLAQLALGAGGQDDVVPGQPGDARPVLGLPALRLPAGRGVKGGGALGVGGVGGLQARRLRGGLGGGVGLPQVAQRQGQRVVKARVLRVQRDGLPERRDGLAERLAVLHDPVGLPQRLGGRQDAQAEQGRRQVPQRPPRALLAQGRRHQALPPPLPGQPQLIRPLGVLGVSRDGRLESRHRPRVFPPQAELQAGLKRRVLGNRTHSAAIIPRNLTLPRLRRLRKTAAWRSIRRRLHQGTQRPNR